MNFMQKEMNLPLYNFRQSDLVRPIWSLLGCCAGSLTVALQGRTTWIQCPSECLTCRTALPVTGLDVHNILYISKFSRSSLLVRKLCMFSPSSSNPTG
jgi:hypothetical protein